MVSDFRFVISILTALLGGVFLFSPTHAETIQVKPDRYVGYYYPAPQTRELYKARVPKVPDASRRSRIAFVTSVTGQTMRLPYPPDYAIFAKGEEARKLIIVGLDSDRYNNLYRMRALLAIMTAISRTTTAFRDAPDSESLTFLDMVHAMGFDSVTISDGATATHQIFLQ